VASRPSQTKRQQIEAAALTILEENPQGVAYADLKNLIQQAHPGVFNAHTVDGTIWNLDRKFPDRIANPERGLFILQRFREAAGPGGEESPRSLKPAEVAFYQPLARWLEAMEEVTRAIALGGNAFQDKWGTPDVIGVRESRRSDIIQMPTEIVSADIKTDAKELITAFGQACAYQLFSHKVWLVIPASSKDLSRVDSLCQIFGIGLVTFDGTSAEDPKFQMQERPVKHEPDWFYVNQHLKVIEERLFGGQMRRR